MPATDMDGYFKFTFTRNPYDRIYSGYLQDRHAAVHLPRWTPEKKPIFDEIGDDFEAYLLQHVANADLRADWRWICFCPMIEFAYVDGECQMDFVGRAETLEADLDRLAKQLKLPVTKAEDQNVRNGLCLDDPKYLHHYTRRSIEAVNDLYRQDFEMFGYPMISAPASSG